VVEAEDQVYVAARLTATTQNFQGGGKRLTNYFTHQDRQQCETNVLEYAKK
jgi:hypothetical protein